MKLLFASSDRDLLLCYGKLLQADGRTVLTAFDGPQLYTQLAGGADLVITDARLPRLELKGLLRFLKEEGSAVILLINEKKTREKYRDLLPEEAFLPYPFAPDELEEKIREILKLKDPKAVTL